MDFQNNQQLQLAYDFVQFTGRHVFLTGKAGTGKTTFLHYLRNHLAKRLVVVAPTGVAAINASGVTIHSFFQISFGPQVPAFQSPDTHRQGGGFDKSKRFNKEKIAIIKSMDLLVIDEISMVRADLLDAIDAVLKRFRNRSLPFGGVQLLMIGDLQQLAPVVKEDEWGMLRKYYDTPFFFSSLALKQTHYVTIELQHVYRQKDEVFIRLLNKIRDNEMEPAVIEAINARYKPDFHPDEEEGYITLTTHNWKAKEINDEKLRALAGKAHLYEAKVNGNFPEYTYPTDSALKLKTGAQVMFVKNDPEAAKLYYNGKIGKVVSISKDMIKVQCPEEEEAISVVPVEWQKMKYSLDESTKEIAETVEGTFTQLPLKTAWAITIHKSQGLTFEKAIIDAQAAFAHGQVYVALSRCKSLEGLVLSSPVTTQSVKQDTTVKHFTKYFEENQPDKKDLEKSQQQYRQQLLVELFDFHTLQKNIYYLIKLTKENAGSLQGDLYALFKEMSEKVKTEITEVSEKFQRQLVSLLSQNPEIEKNGQIQERIQKGSLYFLEKIKEYVQQKTDNLSIETDNKAVRKTVRKALERMTTEAHFKVACLQSTQSGFKVQKFLEDKAKAAIDEQTGKRKRKKVAFSQPDEGIPQPKLYNRLKDWRDAKADELNWQHYMVLPLRSMRQLSIDMPGTLKALKKINGFGKKRMATFGNEILQIIQEYCEENNLAAGTGEALEMTLKKSTKEITFERWQAGKSIEEIAKERELATTTIEGHLAYFVGTGDIPVDKLVPIKKLLKIAAYFQEHESSALKEAKEALDDTISYAELHYVLQHLKYKGVIEK